MDKLIDSIIIADGNLEYIAKTKIINGTLRMEIKRVMTEYAKEQDEPDLLCTYGDLCEGKDGYSNICNHNDTDCKYSKVDC